MASLNRGNEGEPEVVQLVPGTKGYPDPVQSAFANNPPTLTVRGNIALLDLPGLGFCGSRKASQKGLEAAWDCADQAARQGFVVVSGNAAGVDSQAHLAALKAGGSTILVLPEGIDHFRVRRAFKTVWDWGRVLVISQFEPEAIWRHYRAMSRNELIIALSRAVIVIEAGEKGGTLAAGLSTLKSQKPLFVANYEAIEEQAPGNARLLSMGAHRLSRSRRTGRANIARLAQIAATGSSDSQTAQKLNLI